MNVLAIDVGGTHVKILATGQTEPREFASGPALTARQMVAALRKLAGDWKYDAVAIGYPGPVLRNRPVAEPHNLGPGWVAFDYEAAFGCPVKVVNDAAMQALGGYKGGRMLFLGLGTGLGTAMIVDGVVEPMELGHLPYRKATYEDYVGLRGLERLGKKKWRRHVADVVKLLSAALQPDYVEEAWRIVDPVLKAGTPVHEYEPGSWGPAAGERERVPARRLAESHRYRLTMKIEVLADPDALAHRAAEFIAVDARAAAAELARPRSQ